MWEYPVLGSEDQKDGKRFMALCIDPTSKNPYMGIARQVTHRKGSPDVEGFVDRSKLVSVKRNNLLNWEVVADLKIIGLEEMIKDLRKGNNYEGS